MLALRLLEGAAFGASSTAALYRTHQHRHAGGYVERKLAATVLPHCTINSTLERRGLHVHPARSDPTAGRRTRHH